MSTNSNTLLVTQLGLTFARLAMEFAQLRHQEAGGKPVSDEQLNALAARDDMKAIALDLAITRHRAQRLKDAPASDRRTDHTGPGV